MNNRPRLDEHEELIAESEPRSYRNINSLNRSVLASMAKYVKTHDVQAFSIVECEVISQPNGQKVERQKRYFVKLTANSQGELCYVEPPNSIKLITNGSKPLFLEGENYQKIQEMDLERPFSDESAISRIESYRGNAYVRIMENLDASVESNKKLRFKSRAERIIETKFAVPIGSNTARAAIQLYLTGIETEISSKERNAERHIEKIVCKGYVENKPTIIEGLIQELSERGYKVSMHGLPKDHPSKATYKNLIVVKVIR